MVSVSRGKNCANNPLILYYYGTQDLFDSFRRGDGGLFGPLSPNNSKKYCAVGLSLAAVRQLTSRVSISITFFSIQTYVLLLV